MTRTSNSSKVHLAISNWIGLISMLVTILGSGWGFTVSISSDLATLKSDVAALSQRMQLLEYRPAPLGEPVPIHPRKVAAASPPPNP